MFNKRMMRSDVANPLWPLVVILLSLFLLKASFATDISIEQRSHSKIKRNYDVYVTCTTNLKASSFKKNLEQTFCLDYDYETNIFYSIELSSTTLFLPRFVKKVKNSHLLARAPPQSLLAVFI